MSIIAQRTRQAGMMSNLLAMILLTLPLPTQATPDTAPTTGSGSSGTPLTSVTHSPHPSA